MTKPAATFSIQSPRGEGAPYAAPHTSQAEVSAQAEKLREGQVRWGAATVEQRAEVLQRWRVELEGARQEIVAALKADTGRAMLSSIELDGSMRKIDSLCERAPVLLAQQSAGNSQTAPTVRYEHQRVPFGLVGVISPWNFPLLLTLTDAIPALLAGNAVLAKPSEITPRFIAPLQASIERVPELASVFSVIAGLGDTGAAVIDEVDAVCFTGSVATGRKVGAQAGGRLIPAFLELGGKDPLVVLESADLASSVAAALRASVVSTGQACQSIERIYVHESMFDEFVAALVAAAKKVQPNIERIDSGHIGPFIDSRQADKVAAQIDDAVAAGATLHCGGVERRGDAAWCRPAVLTGVDHSMLVYREETFGPVLPVMSFATDEQAIAYANDSEFGLSAAVLGEPGHALAVARQINAGAVSVNDGGLTTLVSDVEKESFGASGVGRSRMGDTGLLRFLRTKALLIQSAPPAPIDAYREIEQPAN